MNSKYWKLQILILLTLVLVLFARWADAYLDPPTGFSIFSILAPLFATVLVFLGFLIRPFVRIFKILIKRLRKNEKI